MRVIIVTVYNSYNCGSALQAKALCESVRKLGFEPALLKTNARSLLKSTLGEICVCIKQLKFCTAWRCLITGIELRLFVDELKIDEDEIKEDDFFILGSDEIWNVSRREITDYHIFWGEGLNSDRTISYAPSVNNSCVSDFYSFDAADRIKRLKAISVRDNYSLSVVKEVTGRADINLVCDPTMLLDRKWYEKKVNKKCGETGHFILIYGNPVFFSKEIMEELREFADSLSLKIYSYMENMEIADKKIYGGPVTFLSMVNNADYVVGSSFHVTVFSIIFHKMFAVSCEGNNKVKELLEQMGLTDRIYKKSERPIGNILKKRIDYDLVEQKVSENTELSKAFLEESLMKAGIDV